MRGDSDMTIRRIIRIIFGSERIAAILGFLLPSIIGIALLIEASNLIYRWFRELDRIIDAPLVATLASLSIAAAAFLSGRGDQIQADAESIRIPRGVHAEVLESLKNRMYKRASRIDRAYDLILLAFYCFVLCLIENLTLDLLADGQKDLSLFLNRGFLELLLTFEKAFWAFLDTAISSILLFVGVSYLFRAALAMLRGDRD